MTNIMTNKASERESLRKLNIMARGLILAYMTWDRDTAEHQKSRDEVIEQFALDVLAREQSLKQEAKEILLASMLERDDVIKELTADVERLESMKPDGCMTCIAYDEYLRIKQEHERALEEIEKPLKAFVELYHAHCAYEESKTKRLQEAANLARQGRGNEANKLLRGCDNDISVFDYSKVNKGLVEALETINRLRGRK